MRFFKTISIMSLILFSASSWGWGGRGHDSICEVAVHLVKDASLKDFLKSRGYMMGHLCNVPDTQWRSLDSKLTAAGNPTHYIDPEIVGAIPKTLSLDLKKLKKEHTGKTNQFEPQKKIFNVPREMGTAWWRVDQFMREVVKLKPKFAKASPPQNKAEEQSESLPYNQAVYEFMTLIGVMGHYVGDLAQPLHNTADYDGWAKGHGGLHGFYEEDVVSEISADIQSLIRQEAQKIKTADWLKGSTLEKLRAFSQVSFDEYPEILKLDPVTKKSEVKVDKGMSIRTSAERKAASTAASKLQPMIIGQMARSAKLLAHLWDEAYQSAGKPPLVQYKSHRYPTQVEFLFPDYE